MPFGVDCTFIQIAGCYNLGGGCRKFSGNFEKGFCVPEDTRKNHPLLSLAGNAGTTSVSERVSKEFAVNSIDLIPNIIIAHWHLKLITRRLKALKPNAISFAALNKASEEIELLSGLGKLSTYFEKLQRHSGLGWRGAQFSCHWHLQEVHNSNGKWVGV